MVELLASLPQIVEMTAEQYGPLALLVVEHRLDVAEAEARVLCSTNERDPVDDVGIEAPLPANASSLADEAELVVVADDRDGDVGGLSNLADRQFRGNEFRGCRHDAERTISSRPEVKRFFLPVETPLYRAVDRRDVARRQCAK